MSFEQMAFKQLPIDQSWLVIHACEHSNFFVELEILRHFLEFKKVEGES